MGSQAQECNEENRKNSVDKDKMIKGNHSNVDSEDGRATRTVLSLLRWIISQIPIGRFMFGKSQRKGKGMVFVGYFPHDE